MKDINRCSTKSCTVQRIINIVNKAPIRIIVVKNGVYSSFPEVRSPQRCILASSFGRAEISHQGFKHYGVERYRNLGFSEKEFGEFELMLESCLLESLSMLAGRDLV